MSKQTKHLATGAPSRATITGLLRGRDSLALIATSHKNGLMTYDIAHTIPTREVLKCFNGSRLAGAITAPGSASISVYAS